MVIYKTTNLINLKIYIGKDTRNNSSYLGSGLLLKAAIIKYGEFNFKKDIVQHCFNKKELDIAEKHWIKYYNSTDRTIGYNIADGGQGGNLGEEVNKLISKGVKAARSKVTPEQKKEILIKFKETIANRSPEKRALLFERMSNAKKGKSTWSKGKKGLQVGWNKGLKMTEEQKQKLRGRIRTPDHCNKISKARKGIIIPSMRKKVKQLDMETGEVIKIWDSMTDAANAVGSVCCNIKKVIDGKNNHCKGFKWALL